MRTLEQIKYEYAVSKGYITIIDIINESIIEHDHERILKLINDISIESQKECLKLASDNIDYEYTFLHSSERNVGDKVAKQITNENNIIK